MSEEILKRMFIEGFAASDTSFNGESTFRQRNFTEGESAELHNLFLEALEQVKEDY